MSYLWWRGSHHLQLSRTLYDANVYVVLYLIRQPVRIGKLKVKSPKMPRFFFRIILLDAEYFLR